MLCYKWQLWWTASALLALRKPIGQRCTPRYWFCEWSCPICPMSFVVQCVCSLLHACPLFWLLRSTTCPCKLFCKLISSLLHLLRLWSGIFENGWRGMARLTLHLRLAGMSFFWWGWGQSSWWMSNWAHICVVKYIFFFLCVCVFVFMSCVHGQMHMCVHPCFFFP